MNYRSLAIVAVLVLAGSTIAYMMQPPQSQPGEGAPIVDIIVPDLSAIEMEGQVLYNASCAACHGVNIEGKEGIAPSFVDPVYRPVHHSDGAYYVAVQNGVRAHHWRFGSMPAIDGVDRDDVTKIITYVRAIQRANGIN